MLTTEQKELFARIQAAVEAHDGDLDEVADWEILNPEKVVETRESVEDFVRRWGRPTETLCGEHTVYSWKRVQTAPGKARGDLDVVDFGDARAVYFSGEA